MLTEIGKNGLAVTEHKATSYSVGFCKVGMGVHLKTGLNDAYSLM